MARNKISPPKPTKYLNIALSEKYGFELNTEKLTAWKEKQIEQLINGTLQKINFQLEQVGNTCL